MINLPALTKTNGVPLYVQIRESIRQAIITGKMSPGDQLPAEDKFAPQLGVSRMTLRMSINELIDEGILYRKHGVGTFVARPRVDKDHSRLVSFFEEERAKGRTPSCQIFSTTVETAKPKVAKALDLQPDDRVICFEMLQFSDDAPITILHAYVPYKLFPDLLEKDMKSRSVWEILEGYGYRIDHALQRIEGREATKAHARMLKIKEGGPVIYKERTVYSDTGIPLEYIECFNRGDMYSMSVILKR